MEERFAELQRNRSKKLAKAEERALEMNDLRRHQPNELVASVPMEGGASGLSRVSGCSEKSQKSQKRGGFFGSLLASIAAPLAISAIRKVTGLGKKKMKGGIYTDAQFGKINEPKPMNAEQALGVAKQQPMAQDMTPAPARRIGSGYGKKQMAMEVAHMEGKGRAGAGRAGAGSTGAGSAGAGSTGAGDKRKARGAAVSKLMKEQGMSLPQASSYLKQNGY